MKRNYLHIILLALAWSMSFVALPAAGSHAPVFLQQEIDSVEVGDDADTTLVADTLMLPWPQSVQTRLSELLQHSMFETSFVGLMVYDLDADSTIFAYNERKLMRPASTMKLVTAIAALDRLGGNYQFSTELRYTGTVENNTLTGNVYCVGGCDPRFNADDLRAFVESIRKMGVDTIRGSLYADRSMKDSDHWGRGWCWDDDNNPELTPLLIGRKDQFMSRFLDELRESGVVVEATTGEGVAPESAYSLCRRFHTMDQILIKMMKESDNLYAESMFYQVAASTGNSRASAKDARSVINKLVSKVGLDASRYAFADGSGLSLYNYVSAELEVRLLRYAFRNNNIYLHLHPSLPEAGFDGTLKKRMHGAFTRGNVYAKTGTLEGVSALAGYCTAANGHRLAFSIINNGVMHGRNARSFQDRVCTALCQP